MQGREMMAIEFRKKKMKKKCDEGSFNLSKSKKNVRPYGKVRKDNKKLV